MISRFIQRTLLLIGLACGIFLPAHAAGQSGNVKVFSAELIGNYSKQRLADIANHELQVFLTGSTRGFEHFKGKFAPPATTSSSTA